MHGLKSRWPPTHPQPPQCQAAPGVGLRLRCLSSRLKQQRLGCTGRVCVRNPTPACSQGLETAAGWVAGKGRARPPPGPPGPQGGLRGRDGTVGVGTKLAVAASAEPRPMSDPRRVSRFPTQLRMSPASLSPPAPSWPPLPPPHSQNLAGNAPRLHPLTVGSAPSAPGILGVVVFIESKAQEPWD